VAGSVSQESAFIRALSERRVSVVTTPSASDGILAVLKEAGWLLLVVLLCPLAILIVGTPVALLVRLLIEIAGRM
jgi:hypothetical protein